jgi:hypothetical protein
MAHVFEHIHLIHHLHINQRSNKDSKKKMTIDRYLSRGKIFRMKPRLIDLTSREIDEEFRFEKFLFV